MSFTDILWIFIILSLIQPVIMKRWLESTRQRLIARIEKKRKSRVILLVHRQETMSLIGFPVFRYIDIEDAEAVMRAIELTEPGIPLDIVLHTPGGLAIAAFQIACALKKYRGKVRVIVPHYAMSGGTLIALAADEIIMSQHAILGPVDPQIGNRPAVSYLNILKKKPVEKIDDETLIMADISEKAIIQSQECLRGILSKHYSLSLIHI